MERASRLARPAAYVLHSRRQHESRGERRSVGAPVSAARRLPSGAPTRCRARRLPIWIAAASKTTSGTSGSRRRPRLHRPTNGDGRRRRGPGTKTRCAGGRSSTFGSRNGGPGGRAEWSSLLVNTELLDDGDRRPTTVAGLLLFGSDPSRYLPQAKIDAAAYFGPEKDYDARERRTLRGPIVRLKGVDGDVLEPGLVERAVDFVRRNIETVTLEDGVRRQARWDYPEEAVREAIVNVIVHRDYLLSGTDIELSIYSDRPRGRVARPSGEWNHAGAHAQRLPERPQ